MKGLLIRWVVSALALYLTAVLAHLLGIQIILTGVWQAFLAVAILAVVNALIRPLLIVLTIPLNCLTLGLLTFVINALMFWFVGSLNLGLTVNGFLPAVFGSIVMGMISGLANQIFSPKE
ncbi:MAG TPA: phage holin family protein [Armatimonadota bacterium]